MESNWQNYFFEINNRSLSNKRNLAFYSSEQDVRLVHSLKELVFLVCIVFFFLNIFNIFVEGREHVLVVVVVDDDDDDDDDDDVDDDAVMSITYIWLVLHNWYITCDQVLTAHLFVLRGNIL